MFNRNLIQKTFAFSLLCCLSFLVFGPRGVLLILLFMLMGLLFSEKGPLRKYLEGDDPADWWKKGKSPF